MSDNPTASEFRNDSEGVLGVIQRGGQDNKLRGGSVKPGDTVWLTEEEQVATANAPKLEANNPFTNGSLTLVTKQGELKNRRPIGDQQEVATPVVDSAPDETPEESAVGKQEPGEVAATKTEEAKAAAKAQPTREPSDEEKAAKAAAKRSVEPKVPQDKGQAKPAKAAAPRPQGSRPAGEVTATPPVSD